MSLKSFIGKKSGFHYLPLEVAISFFTFKVNEQKKVNLFLKKMFGVASKLINYNFHDVVMYFMRRYLIKHAEPKFVELVAELGLIADSNKSMSVIGIKNIFPKGVRVKIIPVRFILEPNNKLYGIDSIEFDSGQKEAS